MLNGRRVLRAVRRRLGLTTGDGGGPGPLRGGDSGASAIEFVMLTPVMFFMIFGAVQFAMFSFAQDVAKAAAQAGARTARAEADADPQGWAQDAEDKARSYVDQLGPGMFDGTVTITPLGPADNVVGVRVTGKVPSILPGMDLTVSAESRGPVERFVPDEG
ncbi:TadE family protein [Streptomyces aidingensis]|uniref:TadE-like protein n=1 Tax=Streptomyces aidingensis TaxID=910347 RepID=A0A1I1FB24_9ACTN|nr:TadE family protein [Streptomyces aidingensis]SFB94353.1 TadE-like protein [Streptomyces aidingensis]